MSAGAILNTSGRGQYSLVNTVPHHEITTFDILEGFQSFLQWGTLFTEFDILEGFQSFLQWGTLFTEGGHYE